MVARTETTDPTYVLGVHSNRAEYGRMIRFVLEFSQGGANPAFARLTAHIAVKYYGQ